MFVGYGSTLIHHTTWFAAVPVGLNTLSSVVACLRSAAVFTGYSAA